MYAWMLSQSRVNLQQLPPCSLSSSISSISSSFSISNEIICGICRNWKPNAWTSSFREYRQGSNQVYNPKTSPKFTQDFLISLYSNIIISLFIASVSCWGKFGGTKHCRKNGYCTTWLPGIRGQQSPHSKATTIWESLCWLLVGQGSSGLLIIYVFWDG